MPPASPPAPPAAASRSPGATVTIAMSLQKSASEPLSDDAVARALATASLSSSPASATSTSTATMPPRAPPASRRQQLPPPSSVIRLNVGGVRLEVSRKSLLEREPDSMLASLVRYHERSEGGCDETVSSSSSLGIARDESGALFLDGDGELFRRFVVPYLRSGNVALLPSDSDDRARLALEADYLQLSGLSAAHAAAAASSLLSPLFPTSFCSFSSPELGASSLWLPADEARARASAAGPEGALDEALCERGGRLLGALELVLSLARGWILASAPGGGGGGGEVGDGGTGLRNNISASAATTTKPPPIVCRLRGRGICHVPRPGCFDAFVEEGVVSCGGPASLSAATAAATMGSGSAAGASSSSSSLAPSISNASALISRLSSTVEREIAENNATSPTQQQQQQRSLSSVSTLSSLSSSSSSAAAAAAAAAAVAAETAALKPSTSDAAAHQHQQQHQQHPNAAPQQQQLHGPRTSFSFSRELEAEFDAPIMIGGGYDKAIYYCPREGEAAEEEDAESCPAEGGGKKVSGRKSWDKCSAAERNRIVYAALSSTPLPDPAEAAIKEAVLALAERPALVRSLLVRRFGFAEGTSVRASLGERISWRPSKTYGATDVFECVQATCVIDLAMP